MLAIAVALFVVFGGGLAVALYAMRQGPPPLAGAAQPRIEAPAPAAGPAAAQAQAPAADTTSNPSTAPDPNPSPALPPTAAPPQAVASAPPPTSGESEVQAPSPAHEPPAPAARPTRRPKREAVAKREEVAPPLTRKQRRERVAAAERAPEPEPAAPTPAPEPPRRKPAGDPLLDVGDDDLEKELAAGPKPKRSVYVPPAPGSDLPDSVSVSQINEAVVGQKAALLRCIDQQKAADPDTKGTLRMRWVIAGDGSARDVRVVSDEFSRQPIAPCITAVVKSLRFPRSRTSGQEVVFPFKF